MIIYVTGDATQPTKKPALIAHCCNDKNLWGKGFVLAIREKFPESEIAYHNWFKDPPYNREVSGTPTGGYYKPELGNCQIVNTSSPNIWVANIIGQHGTQWVGKIPPLRYDALEKGLRTANQFALENGATVHAPRLGSVLAGGKWPEIEEILKKVMLVDTYIYTLPDQV